MSRKSVELSMLPFPGGLKWQKVDMIVIASANEPVKLPPERLGTFATNF